MKKATCFYLFLLFSAGINHLYSQETLNKQIEEIPEVVSTYVGEYLCALTDHQGMSYLNGMQTSGAVLEQWNLDFSLNFGAGFSFNMIYPSFSDHIEVIGNLPTAFGAEIPGEMYYCFIDDSTGVTMVHPFTGDKIGFRLPALPGLGTMIGIAPSVQPIFRLGVGFSTEISFGILPGLVKSASKKLSEDFSITKDFMLSAGIHHDVFHWIPSLRDHNYHLKIGASFNRFTLGSEMSNSFFGSIQESADDLFRVKNNMYGIEYGFSSMGYEAMASKSFRFIDLSLFASYNQLSYRVESNGSIELEVANDFYHGEVTDFSEYTIEKLINVHKSINSIVLGAAVQANLGRFHMGIKYGHASAHYLTLSMGYQILKNK